MMMCIQNLVRFYQFVLKILSGNKILTSIKGRNSIKILHKMTCNNPKLDLVNADVHTKLVRFCQLLLEILSGNEILTSIKSRNSVKILRKMMGNNPKLDLVNVDVYTTFGQILSIGSQDIERKQNSDVNQGQKLCQNFAKNDRQQFQARSVHTKFGQILSICSKDIERKRNFGNNEGSYKDNNSSANLGKLTCIYTLVDIVNIDAYAKYG